MTRKISYKLVASALSLAMLAALASDAFAGWRWHGSGGGSSGGYGSSGGWGGSSGGWGGSSGGWGGSSGGGSSGGWGGWKRHRWFKGHGGGGSSGGWDSGWGSSGGSSGGWGSSGGSYYYSPSDYGGKMIDPGTIIPADPMTPSNPPPVPGTPQETSYRRADGLLAVNVPQDAKVYVNGLPTNSTGAERQYVSRDLQSGYNYTYEVKAEIVRDGKTIEEVKKVNLRAGQTAELAFNFPAGDSIPASNSVETSLTVNVPPDAKVYLAGNPTKAKGETRVFRTTGLTSGKSWDDYTVRVEFERDGQVVSQEKTIRLAAGQSQELTFDFPTEQVASR
jgi:uncharacterized protein (TIGR03000 family)